VRTLVFHASGLTPDRLRLRRNRDSRPWIAGAILLLGLAAISSLFPQRRLAFPVLAVLDAPVNFGVVTVGVESSQQFRIRNDGGADLAIGSVRLVSTAPEGFQVSNACDGQVLHPLDECPVKVLFKPQTSRPLHAELQVTDKSGEREMRLIATAGMSVSTTPQDKSPDVVKSDAITESGTPAGAGTTPVRKAQTGVGSAPSNQVKISEPKPIIVPPTVFTIGFDPQPLIFPSVHVGDSVNKSLVVINQGNANLRIGSIQLAGEHRDDYTLSDTTCPQKDLFPNTRACTLSITFRPSEPGQHDATIMVSDPKGLDHVARLSGLALPPNIPIATLDPPTVELSGTEPVGTVRIRNTGGGTLQIGQPWLGGKNKNDFDVTTCGRLALQNGDEPCLVHVRYKPGIMARGRGYSVAELSLSNNTSNSPVSATVVGRTEPTTRSNPLVEQLIGVAIGELAQQHGKPAPDAVDVKPTGIIRRPPTQYERPAANDIIR
jgi:hypothetical protein